MVNELVQCFKNSRPDNEKTTISFNAIMPYSPVKIKWNYENRIIGTKKTELNDTQRDY